MLVPTVLQPGQQPSYVTTSLGRASCANTMNGITQFPYYQVTPGISNVLHMSNNNALQESTPTATPKKKGFMKPSIPSSLSSQQNNLPHMTAVQLASCTSKTNLYIAGLAENVTDKMVRQMVEGIIEPKSCKALLNQYGKCTGTGFIDCLSEEDAEKAKRFLETVYSGPPAVHCEPHQQTSDNNSDSSQQYHDAQETNVAAGHSTDESKSNQDELHDDDHCMNENIKKKTSEFSDYPPWQDVVREGRKLEVKFAFENEKDSLNVYVRNLPRSGFTSQQLKDLFFEFGVVTSVKLLETAGGDNLTGAGFVRFSTSEEANLAINSINNRNVTLSGCEQPLRCKLADRRIRVVPANHSNPLTGDISSTTNSVAPNLANAVSDMPLMYPYSSITGAPFTYLAPPSHPQFDTYPMITPSTIPVSTSNCFRPFPAASLSSHRMETPLFPANGAVFLTPDMLPTAQPMLFSAPGPSFIPFSPLRLNGPQPLRPVCVPSGLLSINNNTASSLLFQQPGIHHQQMQNGNKQSAPPYMGYTFQLPTAVNGIGVPPPTITGDQLTVEQLYLSMLQQWKQQLNMQSLFGAHPSWTTGISQAPSVGDQTSEVVGQSYSHQLAPVNSSKEFSSNSLPIDPAAINGGAYLIQPVDPCHPSFIGLRPFNQLVQVTPVVTSSPTVVLTSSDYSTPSTNNKTKTNSTGHHLKNSSTNQCSVVFPVNLST